uniref:Uncharacterized protein n=1 Tax=Romanomermis culicivorax TaxID=13658 RepID=A0A915KBT9_ROMCU
MCNLYFKILQRNSMTNLCFPSSESLKQRFLSFLIHIRDKTVEP